MQAAVGVHVQLNVCGAASGTATAVNCCIKFTPTGTVGTADTDAGVTTTVTGITLTPSEPVTVESDCNVAVIVTAPEGLGAVAGAVYVAVAGVVTGVTGVIVPQALPMQSVPLRLQVTAVAVVPVTVAVKVNGRVAPTARLLPSVTVTEGPLLSPSPPFAQPPHKARLNKAIANRQFFIMI